MNNTNKDYYKRVYGKVYASDELKERLMDMKKSETRNRKNHRMAWKAAVAVAAVVVALPTGIYAATHYWGINDFMSRYGHSLSQDANELIETNIPQVQKEDAETNMPVEFAVKESLCDRGSVNLVIEVKAKERGKYLLAFDDSIVTDPVSNLGIKSDKTIGEYAEEKGLEILYVGTGFDWESPFSPGKYSMDSKSVEDDVLNIGFTADRSDDQKDLHVIMLNTVQNAVGKKPVTSTTSFELKDKSSSEVASYEAEKPMKVKGTSAVVTKVTMEKTEVSNYIKIYYTNPNEEKEDGLTFRMREKKDSDEWEIDRGWTDKLGDEQYCRYIVCPARRLPKTCVLEAFDCWDETVYDQFEISLIK